MDFRESAVKATNGFEKPARAGFYREGRFDRRKSTEGDQSKNIGLIESIVKPRGYFWSDHERPTSGKPRSLQPNDTSRVMYSTDS